MKALWERQSIRTRLVSANIASLALILFIFALGVSITFWKATEQGLHRELGREFEAVEGLIEVDPNGAVHWKGDSLNDEADYEGAAIAAEVWASSGKLLVRTSAAERWGRHLDALELHWDASGFEVLSIAGAHIHVLQGQHEVGDQHFMIRVFRSDASIRETAWALVWTLTGALLVALLVAVFVSHQVVGRLFLKPLGELAEHAARISVERSEPSLLPISNPTDEIGKLGEVINGVLCRFDEAIIRIRRFSADASHELRTPLTSIRSVGEVCLRGPRTSEEYQDAIGSILEEIAGITRLLDSLLLLSKADEGQDSLTKTSVDLRRLVDDIAEMMTALCEERGQVISVAGSSNLTMRADSNVLRLALVNLLDNAIKFAPKDSVVKVELNDDKFGSTIDVHNDGESIAFEHRERVFDRFYRIDSGRSRLVGGTGLGLSVARWAIEAHDGTLRVADDVTAGTTFRIVFPKINGEGA